MVLNNQSCPWICVEFVFEKYQKNSRIKYSLIPKVNFLIKKSINSGWREIVCIMNIQKVVITLVQYSIEEVIKIRCYSEPNQKVIQLYDTLK